MTVSQLREASLEAQVADLTEQVARLLRLIDVMAAEAFLYRSQTRRWA